MRARSASLITATLMIALAGCADPVAGVEPTAAVESPPQAVTSSGSSDPVALARAHAWLDAAALPPEAIPASSEVVAFTSYTGWPCGPVAELEQFWTVPGGTVAETVNWIGSHPTGDLVSTGGGAMVDDPSIQSAAVGYIPAEGAQEGIVYTVEKIQDGVAVRAEVAALTADASCPDLPDGEEYGAPGQG